MSVGYFLAGSGGLFVKIILERAIKFLKWSTAMNSLSLWLGGAGSELMVFCGSAGLFSWRPSYRRRMMPLGEGYSPEKIHFMKALDLVPMTGTDGKLSGAPAEPIVDKFSEEFMNGQSGSADIVPMDLSCKKITEERAIEAEGSLVMDEALSGVGTGASCDLEVSLVSQSSATQNSSEEVPSPVSSTDYQTPRKKNQNKRKRDKMDHQQNGTSNGTKRSKVNEEEDARANACAHCSNVYARPDTLHNHMMKAHNMTAEDIKRYKEIQRRKNHIQKMEKRGTPYTREYIELYLNLTI